MNLIRMNSASNRTGVTDPKRSKRAAQATQRKWKNRSEADGAKGGGETSEQYKTEFPKDAVVIAF